MEELGAWAVARWRRSWAVVFTTPVLFDFVRRQEEVSGLGIWWCLGYRFGLLGRRWGLVKQWAGFTRVFGWWFVGGSRGGVWFTWRLWYIFFSGFSKRLSGGFNEALCGLWKLSFLNASVSFVLLLLGWCWFWVNRGCLEMEDTWRVGR